MIKPIFIFISLMFAVNHGHAQTELKCEFKDKDWEYLVTLVDERWPAKAFCLAVHSDNTFGVEQLRERLDNGLGIGVPIGRVVEGALSREHNWNYHIDPMSVIFGDVSIEVCDATFEFVETHLNEWMRDVIDFCPWAANDWVHSIEKKQYQRLFTHLPH